MPTCAEHFATSYWRARQQAKEPELPITLPFEIEVAARAALLDAHRSATV
jgi:hypothetical protein